MGVVREEGKGKREGRREKDRKRDTIKTGLRAQPEGNTSDIGHLYNKLRISASHPPGTEGDLWQQPEQANVTPDIRPT